MEIVLTAMHMIEYCYIKGIWTGKDENEAKKWLRMTSDNNVERVAEMLGILDSILG